MDPFPFHLGITTDDLASSMRALGAALGTGWTTPTQPDGSFVDVDGQPQRRPRSCISLGTALPIDLIEGEPGTLWHSDTTRVHHLAYWTDDVAGDVDRLAREGWRLELTEADANGSPTRFAYLIRDDGFRIELIDVAGKADYERRSRP